MFIFIEWLLYCCIVLVCLLSKINLRSPSVFLPGWSLPGFDSAKYHFPTKFVFHFILSKDWLMFFPQPWQPNTTSECLLQQKKRPLFTCQVACSFPILFTSSNLALSCLQAARHKWLCKYSFQTHQALFLWEISVIAWWTWSHKGHPRADIMVSNLLFGFLS